MPEAARELQRLVEVRFTRQTKALPVPYRGSVEALLEDFLARYAQRYGAEAVPDTAGFELVTFVVAATGRLPRPQPARHAPATDEPRATATRRAYDAATNAFADTPVYDGAELRPGHRLEGPAIVEYPGTTVALLSGQTAIVDELLNIEIRRQHVSGDYVLGPSPADWEALDRPLALDPVTFEILRHKLEAVNEEQAIALKDVSVSPIVTAASDFNNAIYTADGRIASMGPQVVFHSGAMPVVLRHAMEAFPPDELEDGDMIVVNDPYYGAVHHPDVSLVAPIFHGGELLAWAGVAAHQVDMGGMSVGSISVNAREKQQEGLMMPPIKLIERGRLRGDVWRLILNMTRQPQMVGLDLRGFIASNVVARDRLRELADRYGADTVRTAMEELIRYSERRLRERLRTLPDGVFRTRGFLDHDGTENRVYRTDIRLEKDGDVLRFDMRDSSPQAPTYINCTEGALVGAIFGGVGAILGAGHPLEPRDPERARGDRAAGPDRERAAAGGDRRGDDRPGLDDHERRDARDLEAARGLAVAAAPLVRR